MKKIVLVVPPQEGFNKDYLPSIGIGYIASSLEKANFEVKIIDSYAQNLTTEETIKMVLKKKPDAIGVTATTHNRFQAISVCQGIKRKSKEGVFISVGGYHFSLNPTTTLETIPEINAVVMGEGETTFPDLLNHYFQGKSLDDVLGIAFRKNGKIIKNPPRPFIENLDDLPTPAWHLFDFKKYNARLEGLGKGRAIGVMSSRGCPQNCIFCANSTFWQRLFRRHSPQRFVNEVEFLFKEYGFRAFDFWDDTLTIFRPHVEEICQEILARNLPIRWYARARVNTVDFDLLSLMKKAGMRAISFGVESGSERILKIIQKNITTNQVREVGKICKDLDLVAKFCFMFSLPGEAKEDLNKTLDLMTELNSQSDKFHCYGGFTRIYPGTSLEALAKKEGLMAEDFNWSKPIKFKVNEKLGVDPIIPLYENKDFPLEEIGEIVRKRKKQEIKKQPTLRLIKKGLKILSRTRNLQDVRILMRKAIDLRFKK